MVALQPPRSAVLAEAAFVARFSQCAGDVLGNALNACLSPNSDRRRSVKCQEETSALFRARAELV